MRLTLSTLRGPRAVSPDSRAVEGGEFTLGRAPGNSWVLPDPDRHLSKRHCILAWRDGAWRVTDISTNGTFLNAEEEPIGKGAARELRDGDRIHLGGYEIAVQLQPDAAEPAAAPASPNAAAAPGGEAAMLAAFLRGAGMTGARLENPEASMEALGAAFRATVAGLRAALIARAATKGAFRIEQTMIRARGNNPLKFSTDDEDALAALLGAGRRATMSPSEAVAEVLRDLELHETALRAAMQAGAQALLAELAPAAVLPAGGGAPSAQQKARRAARATKAGKP